MTDTQGRNQGTAEGKGHLPSPVGLHFPLLWASLLVLISDKLGATLGHQSLGAATQPAFKPPPILLSLPTFHQLLHEAIPADSPPEVANGHCTPLKSQPSHVTTEDYQVWQAGFSLLFSCWLLAPITFMSFTSLRCAVVFQHLHEHRIPFSYQIQITRIQHILTIHRIPFSYPSSGYW